MAGAKDAAVQGVGTTMPPCEYCDSPGGHETFKHQVCMPINGRVQCIDRCIHQIVAALNAGGVRTIASCCGHGQRDGSILLEDGRDLVIRRFSPTAYDTEESSERSHSPENSTAEPP